MYGVSLLRLSSYSSVLTLLASSELSSEEEIVKWECVDLIIFEFYESRDRNIERYGYWTVGRFRFP